jgi:LuxR family maltose regulon positive regulatory protein
MATGRQAIPIIRTKLHRPPLSSDLVYREALHARLDEGRQLPLAAVSAPAGYGKSTLMSQWLETRDGTSAWLSLDEADSDVRVFLTYFVAAVRTVFPKTCGDTLAQLEAADLPPLADLAGCLSNDLDALGEPLILTLDDYHRIHEAAIHELLDHLLAHPPRSLQLAILSRRDPPLSLGLLRARHQMTELRVQDLQFTERETATFLERATGLSFESSVLARLQTSTEGWPVGLRLAALALRHRSDVHDFLRGFSGDTRQVRDYLAAEVLSQQSSAVRDYLHKTSILDRFCAPLCETVCEAQRGEDGETFGGRAFVECLASNGLLCVALDERQEWYRYHHLFQDLLCRQLEAHLSSEEIARLHQRAATWFEEHGLLEEAIHHVLQGDGPAEAGRLIVRHRNDILNSEQWHRLDLGLRQLPEEVVEANLELLMLKTWLLHNQSRYQEVSVNLARIEARIGSEPQDPGANDRLRGAVDALRSAQRYAKGHGDLARKPAERALLRLPPDHWFERAFALVHLGGALQMGGDLAGARALIYDALARTSAPSGHLLARQLTTLCFINWVAADLPALRLAAAQCVEAGVEHRLADSSALGRYFIGIVQYHQNELSDAETTLLPIVAEPNLPNLETFTQSAYALASVYQARGQEDKARATAEFVCEHLLRIRNMAVLRGAQAYQAELAQRQGRMAEAQSWARQFDPEPFRAIARFHAPPLAQGKILVAEGSAESRERAGDLLTRLETFFAGIHNTRFLIEVLALRALLRDAQGEEPAALEVLGRAVALAQPGGFIRLFVDLGPRLAKLLNRLDLDDEGLRYVGQILAAFQSDGEAGAGEALEPPVQGKSSASRQPLLEPLTTRELEILGMLANRLSNKEIASQLNISPATVKRHTENIYQKLNVPGRREAVIKATSLSLLRDA